MTNPYSPNNYREDSNSGEVPNPLGLSNEQRHMLSVSFHESQRSVYEQIMQKKLNDCLDYSAAVGKILGGENWNKEDPSIEDILDNQIVIGKENYPVDLDWLEQNKLRVSWEEVSRYQPLTKSFLLLFKDYIDHKIILERDIDDDAFVLNWYLFDLNSFLHGKLDPSKNKELFLKFFEYFFKEYAFIEYFENYAHTIERLRDKSSSMNIIGTIDKPHKDVMTFALSIVETGAIYEFFDDDEKRKFLTNLAEASINFNIINRSGILVFDSASSLGTLLGYNMEFIDHEELGRFLNDKHNRLDAPRITRSFIGALRLSMSNEFLTEYLTSLVNLWDYDQLENFSVILMKIDLNRVNGDKWQWVDIVSNILKSISDFSIPEVGEEEALNFLSKYKANIREFIEENQREFGIQHHFGIRVLQDIYSIFSSSINKNDIRGKATLENEERNKFLDNLFPDFLFLFKNAYSLDLDLHGPMVNFYAPYIKKHAKELFYDYEIDSLGDINLEDHIPVDLDDINENYIDVVDLI